MSKRVAVIGGGPAGMLAAATAARGGANVTLFERNEKLGKKLYITGKGRCNFTNCCDRDEFFESVPHNGKFLYGAFSKFNNFDAIALIESMGVPTKAERGGRMFPESDKSSDIIKALYEYIKLCGVAIELGSRVTAVKKSVDGFVVEHNGICGAYDAVVIACGGMSYPSTGSDGDGYALAKNLGHSIKPPKPSLIPLLTKEKWPFELTGLSLKNVTLGVSDGKKLLFSELGELLFTHFGVSGPLVLKASALLPEKLDGVKLAIDLKPGLSHEQLEARIQRDLDKNSRKQLCNSLNELLPRSLIPVVIDEARLDGGKTVDNISRVERRALCDILKCLPLTVIGTRPLDEAIVTRGGIDVREIKASTMESKLVSELYFAGEMIDVDGFTGGFNIQIAMSTGYLAGESAARTSTEEE